LILVLVNVDDEPHPTTQLIFFFDSIHSSLTIARPSTKLPSYVRLGGFCVTLCSCDRSPRISYHGRILNDHFHFSRCITIPSSLRFYLLHSYLHISPCIIDITTTAVCNRIPIFNLCFIAANVSTRYSKEYVPLSPAYPSSI